MFNSELEALKRLKKPKPNLNLSSDI